MAEFRGAALGFKLLLGIPLLPAGLMARQEIMQGFLHWHIPVWVRRLVTMLPSLVVIAVGMDPTHTLMFSQVVLKDD